MSTYLEQYRLNFFSFLQGLWGTHGFVIYWDLVILKHLSVQQKSAFTKLGFHPFTTIQQWKESSKSDMEVNQILTCSWSPQPGLACCAGQLPALSCHCPDCQAVCAGWQCRPRTWRQCWNGWWSAPGGGSIWSLASCSAVPRSVPKWRKGERSYCFSSEHKSIPYSTLQRAVCPDRSYSQ